MQQTPKASQVTQFLTWHKSRPKQQIDLWESNMVCWTISLFMDDLPIEMPRNALFLRRFSTKHVWFPEGTSGGSKRALESPFTPARGVHCFWRVCAGKVWLEGNPKASESVSWNLWWGRCCWLTRCGRRVRDGSPKISGSIYEKPCKTLDSFVSFFFPDVFCLSLEPLEIIHLPDLLVWFWRFS